MKTKIGIGLVALVVLSASCVRAPIIDEKPIQQALVEDLVLQVRLALSAVAKRYNYGGSDFSMPLNLKKADIKVSTSVEIVEGGKAKLVVISGGTTRTDKNENYILLTLKAPSIRAEKFALSPIAHQILSEEKLSYVTESLNAINNFDFSVSSVDDLRCKSEPTNVIGANNGATEFWADIAALTAAAVDGYLCATIASDSLPVNLTNLEVNVAFTISKKAEGGIEFEIWKVELGKSVSAKAVSGNSITMVFTEPH